MAERWAWVQAQQAKRKNDGKAAPPRVLTDGEYARFKFEFIYFSFKFEYIVSFE
jgi:hypothetical protein